VSEVPLGMLSKAMRFRQSIMLKMSGLGLHPTPVLESDSTYQLAQAVKSGICCAIVPLQNGTDILSDELRIIPIANANTNAPISLLMRRAEPRSALAEKCFEL